MRCHVFSDKFSTGDRNKCSSGSKTEPNKRPGMSGQRVCSEVHLDLQQHGRVTAHSYPKID